MGVADLTWLTKKKLMRFDDAASEYNLTSLLESSSSENYSDLFEWLILQRHDLCNKIKHGLRDSLIPQFLSVEDEQVLRTATALKNTVTFPQLPQFRTHQCGGTLEGPCFTELWGALACVGALMNTCWSATELAVELLPAERKKLVMMLYLTHTMSNFLESLSKSIADHLCCEQCSQVRNSLLSMGCEELKASFFPCCKDSNNCLIFKFVSQLTDGTIAIVQGKTATIESRCLLLQLLQQSLDALERNASLTTEQQTPVILDLQSEEAHNFLNHLLQDIRIMIKKGFEDKAFSPNANELMDISTSNLCEDHSSSSLDARYRHQRAIRFRLWKFLWNDQEELALSNTLVGVEAITQTSRSEEKTEIQQGFESSQPHSCTFQSPSDEKSVSMLSNVIYLYLSIASLEANLFGTGCLDPVTHAMRTCLYGVKDYGLRSRTTTDEALLQLGSTIFDAVTTTLITSLEHELSDLVRVTTSTGIFNTAQGRNQMTEKPCPVVAGSSYLVLDTLQSVICLPLLTLAAWNWRAFFCKQYSVPTTRKESSAQDELKSPNRTPPSPSDAIEWATALSSPATTRSDNELSTFDNLSASTDFCKDNEQAATLRGVISRGKYLLATGYCRLCMNPDFLASLISHWDLRRQLCYILELQTALRSTDQHHNLLRAVESLIPRCYAQRGEEDKVPSTSNLDILTFAFNAQRFLNLFQAMQWHVTQTDPLAPAWSRSLADVSVFSYVGHLISHSDSSGSILDFFVEGGESRLRNLVQKDTVFIWNLVIYQLCLTLQSQYSTTEKCYIQNSCGALSDADANVEFSGTTTAIPLECLGRYGTAKQQELPHSAHTTANFMTEKVGVSSTMMWGHSELSDCFNTGDTFGLWRTQQCCVAAWLQTSTPLLWEFDQSMFVQLSHMYATSARVQSESSADLRYETSNSSEAPVLSKKTLRSPQPLEYLSPSSLSAFSSSSHGDEQLEKKTLQDVPFYHFSSDTSTRAASNLTRMLSGIPPTWWKNVVLCSSEIVEKDGSNEAITQNSAPPLTERWKQSGTQEDQHVSTRQLVQALCVWLSGHCCRANTTAKMDILSHALTTLQEMHTTATPRPLLLLNATNSNPFYCCPKCLFLTTFSGTSDELSVEQCFRNTLDWAEQQARSGMHYPALRKPSLQHIYSLSGAMDGAFSGQFCYHESSSLSQWSRYALADTSSEAALLSGCTTHCLACCRLVESWLRVQFGSTLQLHRVLRQALAARLLSLFRPQRCSAQVSSIMEKKGGGQTLQERLAILIVFVAFLKQWSQQPWAATTPPPASLHTIDMMSILVQGNIPNCRTRKEGQCQPCGRLKQGFQNIDNYLTHHGESMNYQHTSEPRHSPMEFLRVPVSGDYCDDDRGDQDNSQIRILIDAMGYLLRDVLDSLKISCQETPLRAMTQLAVPFTNGASLEPADLCTRRHCVSSSRQYNLSKADCHMRPPSMSGDENVDQRRWTGLPEIQPKRATTDNVDVVGTRTDAMFFPETITDSQCSDTKELSVSDAPVTVSSAPNLPFVHENIERQSSSPEPSPVLHVLVLSMQMWPPSAVLSDRSARFCFTASKESPFQETLGQRIALDHPRLRQSPLLQSTLASFVTRYENTHPHQTVEFLADTLLLEVSVKFAENLRQSVLVNIEQFFLLEALAKAKTTLDMTQIDALHRELMDCCGSATVLVPAILRHFITPFVPDADVYNSLMVLKSLGLIDMYLRTSHTTDPFLNA